MKKVAIFGLAIEHQEYSRNFVLRKAFADAGWCILSSTVHSGFAPSDASPLFKMFFALCKAPVRWIRLGMKYLALPPHDLVFIPYPSHMDAWLACLLAKQGKRKVIVDVFFGLYDTVIRDRGLVRKNSLMAKIIWNYEKFLLHSADIALVDTQSHALMLKQDFHLPEKQVADVPVGIDESLWKPTAFPENKTFRAVFWSTFIPLHGVEVVARAAKLLEEQKADIEFLVIGNGQSGAMFRNLLKKLNLKKLIWIDRFIPISEIQKHVREAHCCLGIFGTGGKAQRVIPYKAYQTLASSKPLITARTPATEQLFSHHVNAVLVKPGEPSDLYKAIRQLADNRNLAAQIGKNGRSLYESQLSNQIIREKIKVLLKDSC